MFASGFCPFPHFPAILITGFNVDLGLPALETWGSNGVRMGVVWPPLSILTLACGRGPGHSIMLSH